MANSDNIERANELQELEDDSNCAAQMFVDAKMGKLQECPNCHKKAVWFNKYKMYIYDRRYENYLECLACGAIYEEEKTLAIALCNSRNIERYKDSQRFSD
ncbi:MAG: hypothetical protein PHY28_08825 [Dehalococcoidales bacterium]|nr:hypothetical protein [Dehalococcoidales bacterium]